jgi:hypothetical protein
MTSPVSDEWILVAEGEQGDIVYWEDEFKDIEKARELLLLLDEIGEDNVDWGEVIKDVEYFAPLRSMDFPPLYDEDHFGALDDFLPILDDPENDWRPGSSFNHLRVYVARDRKNEIINLFKELIVALENYAPIKKFVDIKYPRI